MRCTSPVTAYRLKDDAKGRQREGLTFNQKNASLDTETVIPCGRCIGCRINRSREWAIRCHFEASQHAQNSFITLTYDPDHLPYHGSIDIQHLQIFIRRLRDLIKPTPISYFACAEYGTDPQQPTGLGRPHFHAILFGYQFPDIKPITNQRFSSEQLTATWGMGITDVGNVTMQSAGYVARYCQKKINGDMAEGHYVKICPITGEYRQVKPETMLCSKRPAIGLSWYNKYKQDLQKGYIVVQGKKYPIPKYYKKLLDDDDNLTYQLATQEHKQKQTLPDIHRIWEVNDTNRKVQQIKQKRLTRDAQI